MNTENLTSKEQLHERALKASARWSRRVYKRDGTVPTRPEWLAWIAKWKEKHQ